MTTFAASVTIVDLPVGTTVSGAELFEAVQTTSGVGQSVQLSLSQIAAFTTLNSFIKTVGTSLATTGTATAIVAFVANNGIGTAQLATNIGITGTFSALGTASFSGGIVGTGTLNIAGNSVLTGTFGVVGTSNMTGAFNVVGTALFTSNTFGVVGTALHTGAFGVVGTAIVTGVVNISGTATFSSGIVLQNATSGILVANSSGVVAAQGGMVLLNTLLPNAVASTNDTTSFTSAYRNYVIEFDNVCPATQTTTLQIQLATTGTAFISGGYISQAFVNDISTGIFDTSTTAIIMTGIRATTQMQTSISYGASGWLKVYHPSGNTNRVQIMGQVSYLVPGASSTSTITLSRFNGWYDGSNNPITGINFLFNSGNITTGTFKIYGIT